MLKFLDDLSYEGVSDLLRVGILPCLCRLSFQASRYGLKVIAVEIDSERAEQGKLRPDAREAGKRTFQEGGSSVAALRGQGILEALIMVILRYLSTTR